jgi:hypothetical protein
MVQEEPNHKFMIWFFTTYIAKLLSMLRVIQWCKKNLSSNLGPKLNLSLNLGFLFFFVFFIF